MPRQRQPPTLRKASIENIASHFEDFWCAGSTFDLLEDSEQSDVFTPFQYLCDDMVQEIIDMLAMRNLLRPHHFKLLLHSNIRHLDLTRADECPGIDPHLSDIIKTLATRCQKLTHLRLRRLESVKSELVCTLMRSLPKIVSLHLKLTRLDLNIVRVISENCINLLDLVSDCGLDGSCLLPLCTYPVHPKARPNLRKLIIGVGVHNLPIDIVIMLLKSQTSLQCLGKCDFIDHAFLQMYGEEFRLSKKVPTEWVHNLLDIKIKVTYETFSPDKANRLDLTFQCCPYLTKLALADVREGESLNNVTKLKHLKTLSVSMLRNVDFSTYLYPVLSKIGDNLTYLKCAGFDQVNLVLIGKSCTNLESLELSGVSLFSEQHSTDGDTTLSFPYFTKLKVIHVDIKDDRFHPPTESDIDANNMDLILQNATKLVRLECFRVNVTDKVISKANKKHDFRYLKKCRFESCSSLSNESIWVLLSSDNPLESLGVFDCENVTRQDIDLVRQEAELRQFNIDILSGD